MPGSRTSTISSNQCKCVPECTVILDPIYVILELMFSQKSQMSSPEATLQKSQMYQKPTTHKVSATATPPAPPVPERW